MKPADAATGRGMDIHRLTGSVSAFLKA